MMLRTWMFNPRDRITFTEIFAELEAVDLAGITPGQQSHSADSRPKKAAAKTRVFESDGYVDDQKVKPVVEDGYVADNPPPRPATTQAPKASSRYVSEPVVAVAPKVVRQNVLYSEQDEFSGLRESNVDLPASGPAKKVPNMLLAGSSRPQLRASVPDGGYIDDKSLVSIVKPALRAGGGMPMMQPLDVPSMLANLGLHQYVPLFLASGMAMLDANSCGYVTDYFLMQMGIFNPNHRYVIVSSVASFFQGWDRSRSRCCSHQAAGMQPAAGFAPQPVRAAAAPTVKSGGHIPNPMPATAATRSAPQLAPAPAPAEATMRKKSKAVAPACACMRFGSWIC